MHSLVVLAYVAEQALPLTGTETGIWRLTCLLSVYILVSTTVEWLLLVVSCCRKSSMDVRLSWLTENWWNKMQVTYEHALLRCLLYFCCLFYEF